MIPIIYTFQLIRNFLLSGLPEDLRQTIDKQREFEIEILSNELVAFPRISHVFGGKVLDFDVINSWETSRVKLNKIDEDVLDRKCPSATTLSGGCLTDCRRDSKENSSQLQAINIADKRETIKNLKEIVQQLKTEYGDFPTNRCFKQLYWKLKTFSQNSDSCDENFLYVDILKPGKLEEFFINVKPAKELSTFLQTWNDKSDSIDDFSDDSMSSRFSVKGSNNFVVLTGDNGVGKTSSVYAVASDLNYRVIEVNAGSRRSGKKMLQELQEATQSHRVHKSEDSQDTDDSQDQQQKSLILIEDSELVFESDDGFVSSIQQLINMSKRPVVLTTNNRNCSHLQKFINHNEIAYNMSNDENNSNHIGKYLSLLCLAANYRIDSIDVQHLFIANGRDMRKTINEIEFFVQSRNSTFTNSNDDLLEYYQCKGRQKTSKIAQIDISRMHFESSVISSSLMMKSGSAKKDELMDEIECYIQEHSQYDSNEGIRKISER